jgi:hypothetical protein
VPDPDIAMVCPLATTLSGVPGWAFGQVKVTPSWVIVAPGVRPAPASAWAE